MQVTICKVMVGANQEVVEPLDLFNLRVEITIVRHVTVFYFGADAIAPVVL